MRFAVGLAKKLLIADPIGAGRRSSCSRWRHPTPSGRVWLAVICYAIQIYFDFSGYSDMAIGMARMFGFRFPENFNYPYSADLDPGFLAALAHDAVGLVPRLRLHSARRQPRRRCGTTARNLWIVFLLCGAWHGASWNFIVWGLWHGLFLSIERIGVDARTLLARMPVACATPTCCSSCWSAGCFSAR